jgi:hypothetical protein
MKYSPLLIVFLFLAFFACEKENYRETMFNEKDVRYSEPEGPEGPINDYDEVPCSSMLISSGANLDEVFEDQFTSFTMNELTPEIDGDKICYSGVDLESEVKIKITTAAVNSDFTGKVIRLTTHYIGYVDDSTTYISIERLTKDPHFFHHVPKDIKVYMEYANGNVKFSTCAFRTEETVLGSYSNGIKFSSINLSSQINP